MVTNNQWYPGLTLASYDTVDEALEEFDRRVANNQFVQLEVKRFA